MSIRPENDFKSEWIKNVPDDWDVKRLRHVGNAIIGLTYSPNDLSDENDGTLVLRASNIQEGKIVLNDNVYVTTDIPHKLRTVEGDILICSRNGSQRLVGKTGIITKNEEGLSFGAFNTIFRSDLNQYLYYFFNSDLMKAQSGLFQTTTIFQLTTGILNDIKVGIPRSKDVRNKIVTFLDKETTRIDTLISKKQKQIELLQEKRQAIITQSVTKGLDPTVKMKDSGVEWIGEIPEHWEEKKSKYVLSYNDETLSETSNPNLVIRYVEISDIDSTDGITGCSEYLFQDAPSRARRIVKFGDVILSTVRTYLKAISPIKEEYQDVIVSTGFVVLRPDNIELSSEFSSYYFLTPYFLDDVVSRSVGVSYPACKPEDIVNIRICIPPIQEQKEISEYLDDETNRVTLLERKIQKSIELLKEYRSSLITHAVSGQIDITQYEISK